MLRLKINAALACACCALLWAAPARADDRVLLLDSASAPRSGLLVALRIQLTDAAEVSLRHELVEGDSAKRIAAATALAQRDDAVLVAWVEGPSPLPDGGQEAVLYAVGGQQGRALLQVVRVAGSDGPDMDRTLALKLGEVVDELQRARAANAAAPQLQLTPATPVAVRHTERWGPAFQLGVRVALESPRLGASVHGGAAFHGLDFRLGALLGVRWFPSVTDERSGASVELSELAPDLLARSQWRLGRTWLGVHTGLGWSMLQARGRTALGASADSDTHAAVWLVGVDVEQPVSAESEIGIGAGLSLQLRAVQQRFAVNGQTITELPRAGLLLHLDLRWWP